MWDFSLTKKLTFPNSILLVCSSPKAWTNTCFGPRCLGVGFIVKSKSYLDWSPDNFTFPSNFQFKSYLCMHFDRIWFDWITDKWLKGSIRWTRSGKVFSSCHRDHIADQSRLINAPFDSCIDQLFVHWCVCETCSCVLNGSWLEGLPMSVECQQPLEHP